MQLSDLPSPAKRLIALYAHPIHPCRNAINRFHWMVNFAWGYGQCDHYTLDTDTPQDWSAEWSSEEFRIYEHWNTRLHRNGLTACQEWLDDLPESLTNHTARVLVLFRIAEQNYTFRELIANHVREFSGHLYDASDIDELMEILNERSPPMAEEAAHLMIPFGDMDD